MTIQLRQEAPCRRLAFEADRLANGMVAVYLPGAPDSWIGSVVLVSADRIEPVDIPFSELLGIFERLGRDSVTLLKELKLPEA